MSRSGSHDAYLASLSRAMQIDQAAFDTTGTSVCPTDNRRGTRIISQYLVGDHCVLWCDPDLALDLAAVGDDVDVAQITIGAAEFQAWSTRHGGEYFSTGYDHVVGADFVAPPRPDALELLHPSAPETIALVTDLLDGCSAEDREQAQFDLGDLDPHLVGWIEDGRLAALAGGRPWQARPGFHDLGVIVHSDSRRRGLGAQIVTDLTAEIERQGDRPLYRCNAANEGSWRLCGRIGYVLVAEMATYRWPTT